MAICLVVSVFVEDRQQWGRGRIAGGTEHSSSGQLVALWLKQSWECFKYGSSKATICVEKGICTYQTQESDDLTAQAQCYVRRFEAWIDNHLST